MDQTKKNFGASFKKEKSDVDKPEKLKKPTRKLKIKDMNEVESDLVSPKKVGETKKKRAVKEDKDVEETKKRVKKEVKDGKVTRKRVPKEEGSLKKKVKKMKTEAEYQESDTDEVESDEDTKPKKRVLKKDKEDGPKKFKKMKSETAEPQQCSNEGGHTGNKERLAEDIRSGSTASNTIPGRSHGKPKISRVAAVVATQTNVRPEVVQTVIDYLEDGATIPFLVRYRGDKIDGMGGDKLRSLKNSYRILKTVEERAESIKTKLMSLNALNEEMLFQIENSTTLNELEDIYQPFKSSKKSRVQKASDLGLSTVAKQIIDGDKSVRLMHLVNAEVEEIKGEKEVKDLLCLLISDTMIKDVDLAARLKDLYQYEDIRVISKMKNKKKDKTNPKDFENNFSNYFDFNKNYRNVKPHQILALNRGEKLKELQVTIELPQRLHYKLERYLLDRWVYNREFFHLRKELMMRAIKEDAVKKIKTKIQKLVRSNLSAMGEDAGLNVFSSNLKWMLMSRPIHNHTVLAIDPGYKNGCKVAVVSKEQKILATTVIYLYNINNFNSELRVLIQTHDVSLIAIGNGKCCRETEKCVSDLLREIKQENSDIEYTIVSEQGLSIYSCSNEAIQEYPDLPANLISAVSLAKRIMEPMGELIKVEPKHLGVGMYQHDMNHKRLEEMLNDVVSEVVSLVGVNLNTASHTLLKQIASLNDSRAKAIIQFRDKNGPFQQRKDLLKVKGIGAKTFEQCAGFVRIFLDKNSDTMKEYLDQTIIHPEDYEVAKRFINEICVLDTKDLGKDFFIQEVKRSVASCGKENICSTLKITENSFNLIYESLTQDLNYDIRMKCSGQLFRKEVTSIKDLKEGQQLTGRIENVTHFGAFVDIGLERPELIHSSLNYNKVELHYGQIVRVKVAGINQASMKVSLSLIEALSS